MSSQSEIPVLSVQQNEKYRTVIKLLLDLGITDYQSLLALNDPEQIKQQILKLVNS